MRTTDGMLCFWRGTDETCRDGPKEEPQQYGRGQWGRGPLCETSMVDDDTDDLVTLSPDLLGALRE